MPLDSQTQAFIDLISAAPAPSMDELTPEMARENLRTLFGIEGEPVARVHDFHIPGADAEAMPARAYTPREAPARALPVLLYLHGGGWVAGDLVAYDALCRELCNASGCLLVAIEYRLAPEHKFPAAPRDCFAALEWLAAHAATLGGDPARLAVGGDSAGGNLAAVVAHMARDRGGPAIAFQLLVYPATDNDLDTRSYRELAEGYLLTREGMRWNWNHYLPDAASGSDPLASPLRSANLAGLPPALVITAEYDPLRDEGEAYARRMLEAGTRVELVRYSGTVHAFFSLSHLLDDGRRAVRQAGAALRRVFAGP